MSKTIILAFVLLLLIPVNSHAYLDPGTGSAILQGVIGAIAALAIAAKLYWHRLLCFLGIRKRTQIEKADTESKEQSAMTSDRTTPSDGK